MGVPYVFFSRVNSDVDGLLKGINMQDILKLKVIIVCPILEFIHLYSGCRYSHGFGRQYDHQTSDAED